MGTYSVSGRTASSSSTGIDAIAQLWNPSTTRVLRFQECQLCVAANLPITINPLYLVATSVRGTAGSTVTPDVDNAWDADDAPASGALLDLAAFSVQPTFGASRKSVVMGGVAVVPSSGQTFTFLTPEEMLILPETGLMLVYDPSGSQVFPAADVTFVWADS